MNKITLPVLAAVAAVGGFLAYRALSPHAPSGNAAVAPGSAGAAGGHSAALLWHAQEGENSLWRFDEKGDAVTWPVAKAAREWTPVAFAAHGWQGADMVLWRQATTGELRAWQLVGGDGEQPSMVVPPAGPDWQLAGLADADGDGEADLIWTGKTGGVAVWTLKNGSVAGQAVVGETGGGWMLAAIGDFDGDHRADLFWRSKDGALAAVWALQGLEQAKTRTLADAGAGWTLLAAGALDATPGDDLLWRDAAGNFAGWSGADPAKNFPMGRTAPTDWAFVDALDIDGDGRDELIWRKADTGQVGAWRRADDGTIADHAFSPVGAEWRPVPTRRIAAP